MFEKMKDKILTEVRNSNFVRKNLFFWALRKSRAEIFNKINGKDVSF